MFDADQDYAEACAPDQWKIMGVRLKPFCEGHVLLLKRIGSPFVCEGAVSGPALISALLICSRTFEQGVEFVGRSLNFRERMIVRAVAFSDKFIPRFVYTRAEALAQYMQEASRRPKGIIWNQKTDGKPVEKTYAPSALISESVIAEHYHISLSEILNMPLRKLTFLRYRLHEIDKVLYWRPAWYGPLEKPTEATNG